jgi:hypothetical protein
MLDQSERRISTRDTTAMVVATSTAETATASSGPVFEGVTANAPSGGTVRTGGAMTGGAGSTDAPGLVDGEGADVCAGGQPCGCGTVAVAGDVRFGAGGDVRFGEGFGCGVTVGGALVQQCPSPWCSCDHQYRQRSPGLPELPECPLSPACNEDPAAATLTSIHPNNIRRIDALASIIKSARLIGKSPPGRSYGRVRWDL